MTGSRRGVLKIRLSFEKLRRVMMFHLFSSTSKNSIVHNFSIMASKPLHSTDGSLPRYLFGHPIPRSFIRKSNRLDPSSAAQVYRLNASTIAKTGDGVNMSEAATLRYVRQHTSIPVPEVLESYIHPETGHPCIVMEYIEGKTLDEEWNAYSAEERIKVIGQLKGYIGQLRSIEALKIGTVDGGRVQDQLFDGDDELGMVEPFDGVDAFHEGLIMVLGLKGKKSKKKIMEQFTSEVSKGKRYRIMLTHNDIVARNVMVKGDNVCAIVDWELAGFFPEYWEYCSALSWADPESPFEREVGFDAVLESYPEELTYMRHLWEPF